jgi:hypothetical protein
MFLMRKYELLGLFIIAFISISLGLLFWVLPSNYILDGIGPTTDSLWQIGKLMFISSLVYSIAEYYIFGRNFSNFTFAKCASIFLGPILYIGISYVLDILMGGASFNNHLVSYVFGLGIGQYTSYLILREGYYFRLMNTYAILGILLMLGIYISFGRVTDTFEGPIFKTMNNYQQYVDHQQEIMDSI